MNQEGASGTGKCTVQCTTVDGQKNQTLQTSTSKTPHPKFQCWKKLYLTASVFRVWFFLLTGAKRAAKDNIEIFGGAGLDNNTARVLFHRPSTVVQYWYTEYTEYTGLVSPNIFQLTCKLDHLLETVRAFSLSLSLSLSLRRLHLWPSRWVSFL